MARAVDLARRNIGRPGSNCVRSYGQRPLDGAVGGGCFHVVENENAHGARKAAHPIVPRPWWFEPHGTIDMGQQGVVGAAEAERDLPEPIPDRQFYIDRGQTAIDDAHVHLIPRRQGDVQDPREGVRGVIPGKAVY
jgi:hypothetical protein